MSLAALASLIGKSQPKKKSNDGELSAFNRGERDEDRKKKYIEEQKAKDEEKMKKRKEWAGKEEWEQEGESGNTWMPKKEVIRRLREKGEPATLFGEDDADRRKRLHTMMSKEFSLDDLAEITDKSQRERMRKAAEDNLQTTKDRLEQGISAAQAEDDEREKIQKTLEDYTNQLIEKRAALAAIKTTGKMSHKNACLYTLLFVETAFLEWDIGNLKRPQEEKKSHAGKRETARNQETHAFMNPLVQGLKKDRLNEDFAAPLQKTSFHVMNKEYVDAMDCYLGMTIGNSQWPLGVTQVGIHSRVGRERISSNKQAQILNDTQRKFMQGFKRLITQMQTMHPTDPSKMIRDYY